MGLIILRFVLVMVASGLAVFILSSGVVPSGRPWIAWVVFLGVLSIALGVIALDMAFPRKHLDTISAVYFGLIVGLFLSYVVGLALTPLFPTPVFPNPEVGNYAVQIRAGSQLVIGAVLCYLCISLLMQTKNDFRFIIPYVEFAKEVKGRRPYILDTSVVIDGRIADVVETDLLDSQLIMPRFVITELQGIADSSDRLRRSRGRRGLDILNRLRNNPEVDLEIFDRDLPEFAGQPVDLKLVAAGQAPRRQAGHQRLQPQQGGPAARRGRDQSQRPGQRPEAGVPAGRARRGPRGQGGRRSRDRASATWRTARWWSSSPAASTSAEQVSIAVTSVLQTSAGRMVFGRYESTRNPVKNG